jgi:gas vesicle protein
MLRSDEAALQRHGVMSGLVSGLHHDKVLNYCEIVQIWGTYFPRWSQFLAPVSPFFFHVRQQHGPAQVIGLGQCCGGRRPKSARLDFKATAARANIFPGASGQVSTVLGELRIPLTRAHKHNKGRHDMASRSEKLNGAAMFIAGSLLGAGLALLFAPQSGRKTRRDIRRMADKAKNKAEAAKIEFRHALDNFAEDISEKIHEELDRGKEWTEEKIAGVQRALESGRKQIREDISRIH